MDEQATNKCISVLVASPPLCPEQSYLKRRLGLISPFPLLLLHQDYEIVFPPRDFSEQIVVPCTETSFISLQVHTKVTTCFPKPEMNSSNSGRTAVSSRDSVKKENVFSQLCVTRIISSSTLPWFGYTQSHWRPFLLLSWNLQLKCYTRGWHGIY